MRPEAAGVRPAHQLRFGKGEAAMENRYRPGTIVSARGREWIVLPTREPELLRLRPLTTAQDEQDGQ